MARGYYDTFPLRTRLYRLKRAFVKVLKQLGEFAKVIE